MTSFLRILTSYLSNYDIFFEDFDSKQLTTPLFSYKDHLAKGAFAKNLEELKVF